MANPVRSGATPAALYDRVPGYGIIRFECFNNQRPMLHLAINQNYEIVGLRYDADSGTNLIILEHDLNESFSEED